MESANADQNATTMPEPDFAEPARSESKGWGNTVKRFLRSILIAYTLVVILLGFFQRKLLYHPVKTGPLAVAAFRELKQPYPAAQDVSIKCEDGVTIKGWLMQRTRAVDSAEAGGRPLVIYLHGNAGNRSHRISWYSIFAKAQADVLAIDYHGYADSDGTMTESALEMDCEATWDYATKTLRYKPSDIIVAGTSLGGAAAVYLTARQCEAAAPPAGMIVAATFSSMVDTGASLYPWLPVGAVLVDRYPSDQRIGKVTCPILAFHGDRDRVVQHRLGRKLFEVAPAASKSGVRKKWVELPGVGHNDVISAGGRIVQKEVVDFISMLRN